MASAPLKEHKNCCRLCLAPMGHNKVWKISEKIQQKFFKVTNIQLKMTDKYSNRACKTCAVLLYETSFYLEKLVDNQKKLYGFEDDAEPETFARVEPKIETFAGNFVSIKEERMDESDHSYNYIPEDDRAFSDFDAPDQDSDSEDYFTTSATKASAAKSKKTPAAQLKIRANIKYEQDSDSDSDDYPLKSAKVGKRAVPSNSKPKSNRYTDEQMERAVLAVVEDGGRINETARNFDVPRQTLSLRVEQYKERGNSFHSEDGSQKPAKRSEVSMSSDSTAKNRYTDEQMKSAVLGVVDDGGRINETARSFGVPRQTLSLRVAQYKARGNKFYSEDSPLKPAKRLEVSMSSDSAAKLDRYTEEQLESAVRTVIEHGGRINETAKEFGVPRQTLSRRIKHGPPKPRILKLVPRKCKEEKSAGEGGSGSKRIVSIDSLFCDMCSYSTHSKYHMRTHMNRLHKLGFTCNRCKAPFPTRAALKEHRAATHPKFHCYSCNIDFDDKRPWATHMVRHRRFYTCEVCGIEVQSHRYKHHVESHKAKGPLCTLKNCAKTFTNNAALEDHFKKFHTTVEPLPCAICGNSYDSEMKLKRHIARKHATPNIRCLLTNCSYRSTRKEFIVVHMAKHKDIDEFTRSELVRAFKATKINNDTAPMIYEKALNEGTELSFLL